MAKACTHTTFSQHRATRPSKNQQTKHWSKMCLTCNGKNEIGMYEWIQYNRIQNPYFKKLGIYPYILTIDILVEKITNSIMELIGINKYNKWSKIAHFWKKWKTYTNKKKACFWFERANVIKIFILLIVMYRFHNNQYKNPNNFFFIKNRNIPKCSWNQTGPVKQS